MPTFNNIVFSELKMNKLILFTLVTALFCGLVSSTKKHNIFDEDFRTDLIEKLPPKYRVLARKMKAKISKHNSFTFKYIHIM